MRKFIASLCALILVGTLVGCSSKTPEEIIKEGVDNNNSDEIIKLYSENKMTPELEEILIEEIDNQTNEMYQLSIEEYNNSPYCISPEKIDEMYPVTEDNIGNLGEIISISQKANISEDVHAEILKLMHPVITYSLIQYGNNKIESKDFTTALNIYQTISTNTELKDGSIIKEEAIKKFNELSEKYTINVGETKTVGNIDFNLEKAELSHRVEPTSKPILYSYYSPDNDKVYVYVKANITNNTKNDLSCDEIYDVEVIYNNDYAYTGFQVVQDEDMGFTYSNITTIDPLTTGGVDTLIECPSEVETNTNAPLKLKITFNSGETFFCNLR